MLDLIEAGKLPAGFAENCFSGEFQKDHFIAVNYKHPRVKKLIERAKKVCAEDADVMVFLNACSKGEYADNYDPSKALAKMLPRDPKFDPRPARRDGAAPESPAQKQTGLSKGWVWFTVATILFAIAFAIWKFRSRTTVRSR
ncbi:MAG: hypothetical protein ABI073_14925 [Luteolibacter sp.]